MELLTLALFCLGLLVCIVGRLSILWALAGVRTVKNILITFLLIGMLTALWRAAGAVLCSFFLLFLPLWRLLASLGANKKSNQTEEKEYVG